MKGLTFLALAIVLVACGSRQQTTLVTPLGESQQNALKYIYLSGEYPTPDDLLVPQESKIRFDNRCNDFIKTLPQNYVYGFVEVPEDYSQPDERKIKIFYYGRLLSEKLPVIFFNGGPTGESGGSYQLLTSQQKKNPTYDDIPFLFMDQRGNGCSDPYPQGSSPEIIQRLTYYGSKEIVKDSEALRRQLNIPKWKVLGHSYGAAIAHRYLIDEPNNLIAIYAYANVINHNPIQRMAYRLLSQKRIFDEFFKVYPEDFARMQVLQQEVIKKTCFKSTIGVETVCGTSTLAPLFGLLGSQNNWPILHGWLKAMVQDNKIVTAKVVDYAQKYIFIKAGAISMKRLAGLVINIVDNPGTYNDFNYCSQAASLVKASGENIDTWFWHECATMIESGSAVLAEPYKTIRNLPQTNLLALGPFVNSLKMHPEVPFYLYSGGKDPYVPVELFKDELDMVSDLVTYRHFTDAGHDGYLTESAVWDDLHR